MFLCFCHSFFVFLSFNFFQVSCFCRFSVRMLISVVGWLHHRSLGPMKKLTSMFYQSLGQTLMLFIHNKNNEIMQHDFFLFIQSITSGRAREKASLNVGIQSCYYIGFYCETTTYFGVTQNKNKGKHLHFFFLSGQLSCREGLDRYKY